MQNRYENLFSATIAVSLLLMLLGMVLDDPKDILSGLYHIVTMQDLLITDYVRIAGVGATLVNCSLVTMVSILLIKLADDAFNGFTLVEMGLMAEPGWRCIWVARFRPRRTSYSRPPTMAAISPFVVFSAIKAA